MRIVQTGLTMGEAIEQMKQGKIVLRKEAQVHTAMVGLDLESPKILELDVSEGSWSDASFSSDDVTAKDWMVVFDDECWKAALIGVAHDGRAVYDMDMMIELKAKEFEDEAIRSLPYTENAPIVMDRIQLEATTAILEQDA